MTTYNIRSRHAKVSEAVAAAGIDLSYNERLAKADLVILDRDAAVKAAYVLESEVDGSTTVWFEFHCDIKLFNRYQPFYSMLHAGAFRIVTIAETTVTIGEPRLNRKARKLIGEIDLMVSA